MANPSQTRMPKGEGSGREQQQGPLPAGQIPAKPPLEGPSGAKVNGGARGKRVLNR